MGKAYLLPNVGTTGAITLKAPFDGLCAPNIPYQVSEVRSLQGIASDGLDPFTLFYDPFGLTQANYADDVANNVCILSLLSPSGETLRVPNSYLVNLPVSTGLPYSTTLVGVNLGALPEDMSLAYFISAVQDLAHDLLGVTGAVAKAVKTSATMYLSITDAEAIEAARNAVMVTVVTDRAKLVAAQSQIQTLTTHNADLEAFVLANLPPP